MKTICKPIRILLLIFASVVLLVSLVLLGVRAYFRLSVIDYYKQSKTTFEIPNLDKNFVPQGLVHDKETNDFLTCGYDAKGEVSSLSVINEEKDSVKVLKIKDQDGNDYLGHLGGMEINGDYVYITGDGKASVYVLSYDEVKNAKDGDYVKIIGSFGTKEDKNYIGSAFLTIYDNYLIVGEFYKTPEYETEESHKITTKAGDYNQALALVFELDGSAEFGISKNISFVFSLPDKAQGMTFDNGKAYVSTSWGLSFSEILIYDTSKIELQEDIELYGEKYSLYAFDSASLIETMKIAPMSEEMVIVDSKLYVMCESASNKYIFGKFTGAKYCYATELK